MKVLGKASFAEVLMSIQERPRSRDKASEENWPT